MEFGMARILKTGAKSARAIAWVACLIASGCLAEAVADDPTAIPVVPDAAAETRSDLDGGTRADAWITIGYAVADAPSGNPSPGAGPGGDGGASVGDGGSMDASVDAAEAGPPAAGFISAYLGPSRDAGAGCPFATEQALVQIGSPAPGMPIPAANGSPQSGGTVSLSCWVDARGAGFDVIFNANINGYGNGAISVSGYVSPDGGSGTTDDGGTGVFGDFITIASGDYMDPNCTIAFTYDENPIDGGAIAPGSVWGHLDCPAATATDVLGADGGWTTGTCAGYADFLLQNCQ
jgi:hypothetical protein